MGFVRCLRIIQTEKIFSADLAKIKISIPSNQNRSDVVSYVAEILHSEGVEILDACFS